MNGVSVILCCYNSATRLPQTFAHLAAQSIRREFPWEIVLVDNASTDNTKDAASDLWRKFNHPAPLKIVDQPIPGLSYARAKGVEVSQYDVIIFCDDDNWLHPDYMYEAYSIIKGDSR